MIDLDELEHLCGAATPGPWADGSAMCCPDMGWVEGPKGRVCSMDGPKRTHSIDANDAAFIAATRNAMPALIRELRAARACIEEIRRISGPTRTIVTGPLEAYDRTTQVKT